MQEATPYPFYTETIVLSSRELTALRECMSGNQTVLLLSDEGFSLGRRDSQC